MATELVELVGFMLELLFNWRFWVCMIIAGALAFLVYKLLPGDGGIALSIAIAASGGACGLRWQWNSEKADRVP